MESPFSEMESAYYYVTLLGQQVREVRTSIVDDVATARGRRLDALRIVDLKLAQLDQHLTASARVLNDLKVLRRLLLAERGAVAVARSR